MITALALGLALQAGNPVMEFVDPDAKYVSVQAIVKLPHLSGHERAEVALIADIMGNDVAGYITDDMRNMAGSVGDSLKITLMPDHLRIQIGVPPGGLKPAIGYIDAILRDSHLLPTDINASMEAIPFRNQSLWATALRPYKYKFSRIRHEDIVEMYHRICRPENVWLAVGGPVHEGEAEQYWVAKNQDWKPGRLPRPSLDQSPLVEMQDLPGHESMIELRGKTIPANDPGIAARIMALIGLGSGKGSAMFGRLREAEGWSYRQEAILWPAEDGFMPRLIMASGDKTPSAELAKGMKDQLTEAVNAWTEADLARARGMAEAILMRGIEMSPLYFNPSWPTTDSLHDRTFMAGYWQMKTGRTWEPTKLLGQMALLTLDEFKEAASQILSSSEPHILPARG
jgi:hypothetical protein